MIKILDHTQPLDVLASDTSNGLGKIETVGKVLVPEELNGIYEAQFEVSVSTKYFDLLEVGGIVEINTSEGDQMFRIYQITKPVNYIATVKCQHITYDLTKVICLPFTATGATAACEAIVDAITGGEYPFTMTTDIDNPSSSVRSTIPRTFRECLGGFEGSFLDAFRCEYKWDNLEVKMLARRGSDQGVRISYGKNLTDFKQEENNAATYTGVIGYAIVNEQPYYGEVYHKVVATYPRIKVVDFSDKFEAEAIPTSAQLTQMAEAYANANDIEVPSVNMTVSFIPLAQTQEYKNIAPLEDVYLGDTVHIYFEKLGVEASARVIKTVWDANAKRYDSITLGSYRSNMSSVIASEIKQVADSQKEATSFVQSELNDMASLIINGLGLHRTLVPKENGGYIVYLHNKPTLAESDTWYVMSANGILVSTDYGQTWNAGFDSSGNAVLNSLATITLRALEIYGSRITFGDENDKYITAGVYSLNNEPVGISFDGSGYARFRPHEQFQVENLASDNSRLNYFQMRSVGYSGSTPGGPDVLFSNYNENGSVANQLWLANDVGGEDYNYAYIGNRDSSGAVANTIAMKSAEKEDSVVIRNNAYGIGYTGTANTFKMENYESTNGEKFTVSDLTNSSPFNNASESTRLHLLSTKDVSTVDLESYQYQKEGDATYSTVASVVELTSTSDDANMKYNRASLRANGRYANHSNHSVQRAAIVEAYGSNTESKVTLQVNMLGSGESAISLEMNNAGKLLVNGDELFKVVSGTSSSVTCSANNSGSTTVSITIPDGYKALAVANVKSNGDVVPAYTSAAVFGITGSRTLNIWWSNGTNTAKTCTFTLDILCVVNV